MKLRTFIVKTDLSNNAVVKQELNKFYAKLTAGVFHGATVEDIPRMDAIVITEERDYFSISDGDSVNIEHFDFLNQKFNFQARRAGISIRDVFHYQSSIGENEAKFIIGVGKTAPDIKRLTAEMTFS